MALLCIAAIGLILFSTGTETHYGDTVITPLSWFCRIGAFLSGTFYIAIGEIIQLLDDIKNKNRRTTYSYKHTKKRRKPIWVPSLFCMYT